MHGKKLSVEECAAVLGISVHTLRAWIRERRIAIYRVGRRVLIDENDAFELLNRGRVEAR